METCNDKKNLPDLAFEFQGETIDGKTKHIEIILTPDDYVLHF